MTRKGDGAGEEEGSTTSELEKKHPAGWPGGSELGAKELERNNEFLSGRGDAKERGEQSRKISEVKE